MNFRAVLVLSVASSLFALSGCAEYEMGRAEKQLGTLVVECSAKYPFAAGTAVELTNCRNDAENATIGPLVTDPDILQAIQSERLMLATKVDAGQLTAAEALLQINQFKSNEIAVEQQRELAASEIQAQRASAYAAIEQVQLQQQAQQQQEQDQQLEIQQNTMNQLNADRPVTTNCNSFGNQTSCTSQ